MQRAGSGNAAIARRQQRRECGSERRDVRPQPRPVAGDVEAPMLQ